MNTDTNKCPNCGFQLKTRVIKPRSILENNYYWGVIVKILSDELGYYKDEMHEILKAMFLSEIKIVQTKQRVETIKVNKSTTKLTTIQAEEYYDSIRIWAISDLGILLPLPNEENDGTEPETR